MPQAQYTDNTDILRLLQAADAIKDVAAGLDRSYTMCPNCQHRHYADWTAQQVGKQLDAMALKLGKLADELQRKGG